MRRLVLLLLALVLVAFSVVVVAEAATAAPTPAFSKPVHRGSVGKPVIAAKWILSGHGQGLRKPAIHTFHGARTNECGRKCVRAILAARWELGEPLKYDKSCKCRPAKRPRFDRDLYLLLTTKKARPLGWIGRAGARLAQARALARRRQTRAQGTSCAQLMIANAKRELGNHEIPGGSNTGPRVRLYQAATSYGGTGWFWCMAFVNFIARETGILPTGVLGSPFHLTLTNYRTRGPIANGTAGVYVAFDWGRRYGWVRSRPVVGAIVLYMTNGGHTGIVTGVTFSGFSTIEGNSLRFHRDPWGGGVVAHSLPNGYRNPVFLILPCVAKAR